LSTVQVSAERQLNADLSCCNIKHRNWYHSSDFWHGSSSGTQHAKYLCSVKISSNHPHVQLILSTKLTSCIKALLHWAPA